MYLWHFYAIFVCVACTTTTQRKNVVKREFEIPCGNWPLYPKITNSPYLTMAFDTAPAEEAVEDVTAASPLASEARGLTGSESGIFRRLTQFYCLGLHRFHGLFFQNIGKILGNYSGSIYWYFITSLQPETSLIFVVWNKVDLIRIWFWFEIL